ncbi:hypothetical protein JHS3_28120 [Jeongeupia sp. HS-3]|uniref:hypothetical protein n=1 Tax=Jeongeupia sp. HS-3 TaxID=1009682 RepID=UPI0018A3AB02|nr:hypothetical protein [Jeongeupia sp. HS-3]BCL77076.1 hypothetical protein JHS3_28120 [Jeongeupia sp. HS-3]
MSNYDQAKAIHHVPAHRLHRLGQLYTQSVSRHFNNSLAVATSLPAYLDPQTLVEAWGLQQAVAQRLQKQNQQWWDGMKLLYEESGRLGKANTMSKFFEQEYNLYAQFGSLVSDQLTSLMGLMENVQIDYGYWMAQKQAAQAAPVQAVRPDVAVTRSSSRQREADAA